MPDISYNRCAVSVMRNDEGISAVITGEFTRSVFYASAVLASAGFSAEAVSQKMDFDFCLAAFCGCVYCADDYNVSEYCAYAV